MLFVCVKHLGNRYRGQELPFRQTYFQQTKLWVLKSQNPVGVSLLQEKIWCLT